MHSFIVFITKLWYNLKKLHVYIHVSKKEICVMSIILFGGMLIIIIAVVIAVVSSVVSAVAADQDMGED